MVLPCPSERPDNSRWWDELMRRSVLVFFVTLLLGISVAYAGESRPSAEASADRSEVLVGDFIQYFVSLKYPSGVRVEWPSVGGTLGDFVVEASGGEAPRTDNGIVTEERWYRLYSYSTGHHTIPETVVTYQASDGATHEARTQALPITVKSLLPVDWKRQDIRDVKPLIPMRSAWGLFLGALAVMGMVTGVWWWRWQRKQAKTSSAPPQPPHAIAFDALSKLHQEDLPSHNRYEEYYVRISSIVRAYVEARFGLKAPEMTTEEFLQVASNAAVLSLNHRRLLQDFLERCDLVKFARYEPSGHEADEAFEAARRFVQDTAPSLESAVVSTGKIA